MRPSSCARSGSLVPLLFRWALALTNGPFAPEGTPGRLPTVLPGSNANGANSNARYAMLNITGLVIASSMERFERATAEVLKSDIRSTIWIPAVFLNSSNYSMCGGGGNGLRHAMRNAWNLIDSTGVGMVVFEEDIAYAGGNTSSVTQYINSRCLQAKQRCDLAYLGEWNSFFTTHAIYVPAHTARWLLDMTNDCYPWRAQVDQPIHSRCMHRPGRPAWNCIHPPPFRRHGCFGKGFFVQDPIAVPPVLHGGGSRSANKVIA
jgi:hypothetical protein